MKPLKTITNPEAFQMLADETRRKIMFLLRVKEMTVSQIASDLNLTPQAVYHHIKKLQKADMVEVVREERIGHLIESYYRTTAEIFNFSTGKAGPSSRGRKAQIEQTKTMLDSLTKLGFKIEYTDDQVKQLIDMEAKMNEEQKKICKLEDEIENLEELDFVTRLSLAEYCKVVAMTDEEFKKDWEGRKKLRDLLLSMVKK